MSSRECEESGMVAVLLCSWHGEWHHPEVPRGSLATEYQEEDLMRF